jgi:chromosome segregation protein
MPNRLKSLELNGYKTFASKTRFEFSGNITVIVGPNGSGKSNIADAIRWVLGEQSYRLLRGRKTEDMIFSGSETRSRSGMASTTLAFDNSDGWLPIDFSEVSVTRRAYRDGQNEYLINNNRVRLRDVTELLAYSGLAERTYTVIGQGLVDSALTLKSEERRRLFEEAAGIGLYRYRKEQSLRRLEKTKRNLERVQDILTELTPRLKSLQRQALRVEEFEQVRKDLREVLREWYGYHWHLAQKEFIVTRDLAHEHEGNLHKASENQVLGERSINSIRDRTTGLRDELNSWHRQLAQIHSQREETSRELAVNTERRRAMQEQQNSLEVEIARIEAEVGLWKDRLDDVALRMEQTKQDVLEAEKELDGARKYLTEVRTKKASLKDTIQVSRQELTDLNTVKVQLSTRKEEIEVQIEKLDKEKEKTEKLFTKQEVKLRELIIQLSDSERTLEETERRVAIDEGNLETKKSQIDSLREEREKVQTKQIDLSSEISRFNAEIDVLEQAEENLIGYASGAKILFQAAKEGRIHSSKGALGKHLQVDKKYEVAIAAALGDFVDAILMDSDGDLEAALSLLEDEKARVSFLPFGEISPPSILSIRTDNDCFGIAADLVKTSKEFKPGVDLLLGQVFVVKDRKVARQVLAEREDHVRAVTLRGEVFHASGPISVDSEGRAAALRRPREQQELGEKLNDVEINLKEVDEKIQKIDELEEMLQKEIDSLTNEFNASNKRLDESQSRYQEISLQYEQARHQCELHQNQLGLYEREITDLKTLIQNHVSRLEKIESQIIEVEESFQDLSVEFEEVSTEEYLEQAAFWETQIIAGKRALEDAEQAFEERKSDSNKIKEHLQDQRSLLEKVQSQISDIDQRIQEVRSFEGGIGEQISELQSLIEPAESELRDLEGEQENLNDKETIVRQQLNVAERHYTQTQIALARKQEALDTLQQRIEDDFGLVDFKYQEDVSGPTPFPFKEIVKRLPDVTSIVPEFEETLKRQRMQLRRVGSVNFDAQQEYVEVKERHDFLTNQMADLVAAEDDIREVISELDSLMDREFRKTFEVVASEFKEIFTRLFGGGTGRLVMTDSENISEAGIDIEARLPGKRSQRLALLSGGERSLAATALIFALVKASPTPFCVLDEVDAMLDEANVARFRELLSELSRETQFVLITHNRHTVQAADIIYGITMRRDTTSQSISLKLEEVDGRYSS